MKTVYFQRQRISLGQQWHMQHTTGSKEIVTLSKPIRPDHVC